MSTGCSSKQSRKKIILTVELDVVFAYDVKRRRRMENRRAFRELQ